MLWVGDHIKLIILSVEMEKTVVKEDENKDFLDIWPKKCMIELLDIVRIFVLWSLLFRSLVRDIWPKK